MENNFSFEYAIIRIVPKVEREEFFNIGVILYSKRRKFLGIKYHIDLKKLEAFNCEIEYDTFKEYLHAWQLICDGDPAGGKIGEMELADRFRWLAACRSTIIQSSKTHTGITSDPQKTMEDIFNKYVL